jgi:hypothetical protein
MRSLSCGLNPAGKIEHPLMHFPKHWAKAAWREGDPPREAWGWSDVSEADACRVAEERARRFAESSSASVGGHSDVYGYPDRPLREPVLRALADGAGGIRAVITRNSHGCDVLNTDRAVFIDVDLPDLPRPAKPGLFASLFGKPKPAPPTTRASLSRRAPSPGWKPGSARTRSYPSACIAPPPACVT